MIDENGRNTDCCGNEDTSFRETVEFVPEDFPINFAFDVNWSAMVN